MEGRGMRKSEEIYGRLRGEIESGLVGAGERLPNESDLAARFAVSRMTVHHALRRLQEEGWVVRRPRIGTVVAHRAEGRRYRVALVIHDIRQQPHADYFAGLGEALAGHAEVTILPYHHDPEEEARILRRLDPQFEAVVSYASCVPANTPLYADLRSRNLPVLFLDRIPDGLTGDVVTTDNYGSCREMLRRLAAAGHRRMLMFSPGGEEVSTVVERRRAFLDVLAECGEDGRRSIRTLPLVRHWDFAEFVEAIHDTLFVAFARDPAPTVVFAQEDYTLSGTLLALERMGRRVPEDVEIVAISDSERLPLLGLDRIHRIHPLSHGLGRSAGELLLRRIRGDRSAPREIRRPAELISPASLLAPVPRS